MRTLLVTLLALPAVAICGCLDLTPVPVIEVDGGDQSPCASDSDSGDEDGSSQCGVDE